MIGIVALIVILSQIITRGPDYQQVDYQQFKQLLRQGRVSSLTMEGEELYGEFSQREVEGYTVNGEDRGMLSFSEIRRLVEEGADVEPRWGESSEENYPDITYEGENFENVQYFQTALPPVSDRQLQSNLDVLGTVYGLFQDNIPTSDTPWFTILLWGSIPLILLVLFWFYLSRRMGGQAGGGIMNIGKMKGQIFDKETQVDTDFDDVAGLESAKEDMKEVIEFLKSPERFHRIGGKIPKGLLLVGPPGTGKTLMARAVAGEAEVPFFSLTGSSFMEMFVGVGASRVRDLFDTAKENTPCIIFIDELESVGRKRGAGVGGGHDEREQTLNQLLAEMDGFEPRDNIVVIGATNRPDILDPAIRRPGRFDREISVDMPTVQEREEILDVHVERIPLADDVNLRKIAQGTPGFSGADLENLVNEAAIKAAREEDNKVRSEYFEFAIDRIMLGRERKGMVLEEDEKEMVAYHEAGHAIVAQFTEFADPLYKITIIPRGRALGLTKQIPDEEKHNYSREYLMARIQVILGGRAVEKLVYDTFTTGGGDDLQKAKDLSRKMVCKYGMSDRIGHVSLGNGDDNVFLGNEISQSRDYSEKTAEIVDEEISRITEECFSSATETIQEHRDQLDDLADALQEKEVLERPEIYRILGIEDELTEEEREEIDDTQSSLPDSQVSNDVSPEDDREPNRETDADSREGTPSEKTGETTDSTPDPSNRKRNDDDEDAGPSSPDHGDDGETDATSGERNDDRSTDDETDRDEI